MSSLRFTNFPRRMFDVDTWMPSSFLNVNPLEMALAPTTLDVFDPFDELDRMMSRNLRWLNRPEFMRPETEPIMAKMPQKYRISIDCAGYSADSIKTEFKEVNDQTNLIVSAHEETGKEGEPSYSKKEFKRSYTLPKHAEKDKMVSFMTPRGQFVVEFPLLETPTSLDIDLLPRIIDSAEGKSVSLKLTIPDYVDPNKVQVSLKDRDLILRFEDKAPLPDTVSRAYYYNRATLPENTNFEALKCVQDKRRLFITAPIQVEEITSMRNIPIEKRTRAPKQLRGKENVPESEQPTGAETQKLSESQYQQPAGTEAQKPSGIESQQQQPSGIESQQQQPSEIESQQQQPSGVESQRPSETEAQKTSGIEAPQTTGDIQQTGIESTKQKSETETQEARPKYETEAKPTSEQEPKATGEVAQPQYGTEYQQGSEAERQKTTGSESKLWYGAEGQKQESAESFAEKVKQPSG